MSSTNDDVLSHVEDPSSSNRQKPAKPEYQPGQTESARALILALFRCFGSRMAVLAIPRLGFITLRYLQPLLISRTIKYVSQPATEAIDQQNGLDGAQLIFAAFVINAGCAVSNITGYQNYR